MDSSGWSIFFDFFFYAQRESTLFSLQGPRSYLFISTLSCPSTSDSEKEGEMTSFGIPAGPFYFPSISSVRLGHSLRVRLRTFPMDRKGSTGTPFFYSPPPPQRPFLRDIFPPLRRWKLCQGVLKIKKRKKRRKKNTLLHRLVFCPPVPCRFRIHLERGKKETSPCAF